MSKNNRIEQARAGHGAAREADYVARGWWRDDDTLSFWLGRHAAGRPGAPAVVAQEETISWAQLAGRVQRLAEGLRRRGIGRGDVVALQLPNVPQFLIAYLAIARLGAVTCTLHMPYRGAEIQAIVRHSGAKLLIDREFDFASLESTPPLAPAHPLPEARDAFLLLYTSGTTASPKGVPHPYRTMLGNARTGASEHRLSERSRILSAAPLTHLYGLYSLHCAWAVGACTVLVPSFSPAGLAQAVERDRPSALWTAPAHVAACRGAGLFERHDWSSLELMIVSGSMAPRELMHYAQEKLARCAVTQLWGMTELQAALYTRPGDAPEVSATTAGRPSPGTEVRISEAGELQVRGPLMFSGYYENEAANRDAFTTDGWFRSGDLAEWREGGNVAITGRTKDIVNRGGVKFNCVEVEALLDAHPKILQSAIVPMPDPVLGEKACAFVTLRNPSDTVTLEDLAAYLLDKDIAKIKLPERLVIVPEMPLTPTRKIIKGKLNIQ